MKTQAKPQAQCTPSSSARVAFEHSIKDAKQLLDHCESLGHPVPQTAEVFKRAGLVMAMTAWETYVEDRILEGVKTRIGQDRSHAAGFMLAKLDEELKRFHNPTWDKTKELFEEYWQIDVTRHWRWQHVEPATAIQKLDELLKKRGDAVHRSSTHVTGPSKPHLVTKDELAKAIRFLDELVAATDRALAPGPSGSSPAPG
jgi:HEPN superfamily RiboL-PSP-like protein